MADTLNKDIVLFALFQLGGAAHPVQTEDIAHRAFQYPVGRQRYRWERYPEYPDKERVARELRRLKTWKGVAFVKGHVNIGAKRDRIDGWMLTPAGVDRVKSSEQELRNTLQARRPNRSVYDAQDLRRRIMQTECYRIYVQDCSLAEAKDYHLTDLLQCLPDAPTARIRSAYDALMAAARAVEDQEILRFMGALAKRFPSILRA